MDDKPKLAVILGAGASYDVCPNPSIWKQDGKWRPPLVESMFEGGDFDEVLAGHPEAASVMATIRIEREGDPNLTFEQSLQRRLDSRDEHMRHQVLFVPIALQEYFFRVSTWYANLPFNYSDLVNRTVCAGIHTAFITVNYDTLLDQALTYCLREHPQFNSTDSYISGREWLLIKVHGSVDWGFQWPEARDLGRPIDACRTYTPPQLPPNSLVPGLSPDAMRREGMLHYPALALPAGGKREYGFVCSSRHQDALKTFLEDCENFIFIGFSARDQDVLNLLSEKIGKVRRLLIVVPRECQDQVVMNLHNVRQFKANLAALLDNHLYPSFTQFLQRGLEPFSSSILRDAGS